MEISDAGLSLIKTSEGFRATVYNDVAGFPTIGYGHKLTPGESFPIGITEAQATALLEQDVQGAEAAVARLVKVALTQGQFDALVDFVYNVGAGRLAGSTLLRMLNAGNTTGAGQQLLLWVYAGGVKQPGLMTRREAELALWNSTPACGSLLTKSNS
jgi:lysozyme